MKRLYSVQEVCALFCIDGSTLRRWRSSLGIIPLIDASHNSRRLYTVAHVVALAHAHNRVALLSSLVSPDDLEAVSGSARPYPESDHVSRLIDVERRVCLIEQRLSELAAPDTENA